MPWSLLPTLARQAALSTQDSSNRLKAVYPGSAMLRASLQVSPIDEDGWCLM